MSIWDWVDNTLERYRRDGAWTGSIGALQELWQGGLGLIGEHVYNYGTHVYQEEWDLLVVLDTCRPDALAAVADEYEFLSGYDPETETLNSLGSRSPEWIGKTFDPASVAGQELDETAYVSANPHTRDIPDPSSLGLLDELWKYAWSEEYGTVPPDRVTDRTIDTVRSGEFTRVVAHYMQPHSPYRTLVEEHPEWFTLQVGLDNPDARTEMIIWERLRTGRISRADLWDAYLDNLRWALDEVKTLLESVDADRVIVTSDHGEAFGEWWYYGHASTAPIPVLKRVPWAVTTATDTGEYDVSLTAENVELDESTVDDRLRDLGYV